MSEYQDPFETKQFRLASQLRPQCELHIVLGDFGPTLIFEDGSYIVDFDPWNHPTHLDVVLAEIEFRSNDGPENLVHRYELALCKAVSMARAEKWGNGWAMITASANDKADAALETLEA